MIAITDVQESKAAFDLAVAEVIRAKNNLDTAFEDLREITGIYHEILATLKADMPLLKPEPEDIDEWTERALEQNPLITASELGVEVSRQEIEKARSENLPSVDLTAAHGYNHILRGDEPITGDGSTSNSIGVNLSYNLYTGGATRARIRIARQNYIRSQDSLEQARRNIQRQVHTAYLNVLSSISRVEALAQAVKSNETALEATQTGFDVGTRTSVDVLDAQRNLLDAKRNFSQSRYDYVVATLNLKQAAGNLTIEDLSAITDWLNTES